MCPFPFVSSPTLLLTGFFNSLLFPLINFIFFCLHFDLFFFFLLFLFASFSSYFSQLISTSFIFCQLQSVTIQFFCPFYSFLMCWHFVLVSIIINQIIITPSLIDQFLQNACLLIPPPLSLHCTRVPPLSFPFCFAIISITFSALFRPTLLSEYPIKQSST